MSDGAIRIDTQLGTDGVEVGLEDIEKMCEDTKNHLEKIGDDLKLDAKLNVDKASCQEVFEETQDVINKLSEGLGFKVKSVSITSNSELDKAQKKLEDISSEIEAIRAETDRMLQYAYTDEQAEMLLKLEEIETQRLVAEQEELNRAVEEYKAKKEEAAGIKLQKIEAVNSDKEHNSTIKEVNRAVVLEADSDAFVSKISTAKEYENTLGQIKDRMQQIEMRSQQLAAENGLDVHEVLAANREYQKLRSRLDALTKSTKTFKTASKDSFSTARKSASVMGGEIKKAIGTMSKYTIAIFGVRSAYEAIKSAIRGAVSENEKLNSTVTAMKGLLSFALMPYIEKAVYYLEYGIAYLNLFIKTLTGVDYAAEYNAYALNKQAEATKEAAKAAKDATNQLSSFDEKNILTNPEKNASALEKAAATLDLPDVSGGKFEKICQDIKKHLNELGVIIGTSMIAVGFILLACGQIPQGIAVILAGIAVIAVSLSGWEGLSDETKRMITTIMVIAGAAFLVLGIILVCTGVALPIGIALIVVGAGMLVTAVALNWGSIGPKISAAIEPIKKYLLGGLEIVYGVMLMITGVGVPLGISLIKEGVKTMVSPEQPNKESLKKSIKDIFENTKKYILGGFEIVLGAILCLSIIGIPLGIALIQQGMATIKSEEPIDKDAVKKNISEVFENTKKYLLGGLELVFGSLLCCTGIGLPLGIALIKQGLATIKSEEPIDKEAVKNNISEVIENTKKYLEGGFEIVFGLILCCSGAGLPLGITLIQDGLATVTSEEPIDTNVAQRVVERMWNNVKSFWNSHIKNVFTVNWWKIKFSAISDGAKAAINTAISFIERGVNWMVGRINAISFTVPTWVPGIGGSIVGFNIPYVNIPRLARGGIVNNPGKGQHIIAGEAGAEAVLPLQSHTEWMDVLAEKIAEKISIPIVNKFYVDSKEVSASHNKNQERFNFATNGGVL